MVFYDYPIIGSEKELPLYLVNMGLQQCQDHVIRPEGFPLPQILYCTKGSGTLSHNGKKLLISPCSAMFLPVNVPHEYYPNESVWDVRWVVFDGTSLPFLLDHLGLRELATYRLNGIQKLDGLFFSMHDALHSDPLFGNYRAAGLLYNFLIEFYRITSAKGVPEPSSSAVRKAVEYIDAHYRAKITLEELCDHCGVSKQHLCLLFRKSLHSRPMEYIAKRKLQSAKELLTGTSMTVEGIAEETGFCTASYFCKTFKRYEGMTPNQFKQNLRNS